jgi:hypothetical protein
MPLTYCFDALKENGDECKFVVLATSPSDAKERAQEAVKLGRIGDVDLNSGRIDEGAMLKAREATQ